MAIPNSFIDFLSPRDLTRTVIPRLNHRVNLRPAWTDFRFEIFFEIVSLGEFLGSKWENAWS